MPKMIVLVLGVSNSGKTSSIRKYLNLEKVFHLRRGDITIVLPLRRSRRTLALGVASGGDNSKIIARNFKFFNQHKWDVIVCASKSRGQTVNDVRAQAARSHAKLIQIATRKVTANKRQENNRIAKQILSAIP